MKKFLLLALAAMIFAVVAGAYAATSNPSPASVGYTPMVIPIQGIHSSATADLGVVKFTAPSGYNVVTASINARAVSGTNPTLKVRISSGVFVNYTGTIGTAGAPVTLKAGTTTRIADESTVAVDLISGGTTPKWRDMTLFILLKRL